jgi:hypothetical protein
MRADEALERPRRRPRRFIDERCACATRFIGGRTAISCRRPAHFEHFERVETVCRPPRSAHDKRRARLERKGRGSPVNPGVRAKERHSQCVARGARHLVNHQRHGAVPTKRRPRLLERAACENEVHARASANALPESVHGNERQALRHDEKRTTSRGRDGARREIPVASMRRCKDNAAARGVRAGESFAGRVINKGYVRRGPRTKKGAARKPQQLDNARS